MVAVLFVVIFVGGLIVISESWWIATILSITVFVAGIAVSSIDYEKRLRAVLSRLRREV